MTGLRAMEADKEHSDNFPVSVGRGPGPDDDQYSVSSGSDTGNVSPGSVMNCEWLAGDNSRQQQTTAATTHVRVSIIIRSGQQGVTS